QSDNDERLRYRSWREGRAMLSAGLAGSHRSRSGDPSHVDKKIEATLPKTEPPASAARSRKSSHYLRLFRENDAAEEQRRREERLKQLHTLDKSVPGYREDTNAVSV